MQLVFGGTSTTDQIHRSPQVTSSNSQLVQADEKPAIVSSQNNVLPKSTCTRFIPSPSFAPRPLPSIPRYLAAVNASGYAFFTAYPNHPLADFAAEEVRMVADERALLLYQKEELREKMLVFHLDKFLLGTDGERRAVKNKKWLKEQEESVVLEYKTICAKLGQRPEVARWFF
ncbi:hypothetical protein BPAE_0088g00240 [Botrytis paeoniae]|uniref:Uncharacterized protein n=1 Tax=Botrytis paeoniae TaxID=278948 RepID=A0A4Z1FQD1_9HELO|nr:hypothetical protein BPAE_0088g00240 [Botrytis paeoniae]